MAGASSQRQSRSPARAVEGDALIAERRQPVTVASPPASEARKVRGREGAVGIRPWHNAACRLLCACLLTVGLLATARPAAALSLHDPSFSPTVQRETSLPIALLTTASFDPDNLITDINFTDPYCLAQADVQSFLAAQTGTLASYRAPDYAGVTRSAAAIIWKAAQAWQVSPKVILVTLQKEQGLLTATAPSARALNWAMGCGVPDSGSRDTSYKGFGRQVWYGAKTLHVASQRWSATTSLKCGDGTVQPENASTYALYVYTPWIGVTGGGNKLFWTVYCRYFGDPQAIDSTPPTTTVGGVPLSWVNKAVTLTLSASDNNGSGVVSSQYKLDGGTWTDAVKLTIPAPADHTNDGVHKIQYRSVDYAGNTEKAKRCSVKVDTTPPTTDVSGADALWHDRMMTVTFQANETDGGSGVANIEYSLDDGASWTEGDSLTVPAPADHTNDGEHKILYRSVDNAGNWEAAKSCAVSIDTRPPRPIARKAASARRGQTAILRYSVEDRRPGSLTADVTIAVRTAAGRLVKKLVVQAVPVNTQLEAQLPVPHTWRTGTYRFFVSATDEAGNPQSAVAVNRLTVR